MEQIILHLIGDYLTQSSWMALNKTKRWWPAIAHATVYSLPFLLIGSWQAVLVIWSTHAVIDRFRLARFVVYSKNQLLSPVGARWLEELLLLDTKRPTANQEPDGWEKCAATGSHFSTPDYLAVWLMIIADNTLHLAINYSALRWM